MERKIGVYICHCGSNIAGTVNCAEVAEFDDGMEVTGGASMHGAVIESHGDHRIAMAFAIAGLSASGETIIRNTACVNTSYPGFAHQLAAIMRGAGAPEDFALPTISHS